jgi:hypothetical protein
VTFKGDGFEKPVVARFDVPYASHDGAARTVYEQIYCQRGDVENRLKELHHGLEMDRTSCSRSWPTSSGSCSPRPHISCSGASAPDARHGPRRR